MNVRCFLITVVAAALFVMVAGGPGRRRPKGERGSPQIQAMKADLEELKAEVAELFEVKDEDVMNEGCKVHFYFHGQNGVSTANGENVNVQVSMASGQSSMSHEGHMHEAHCEMSGGGVSGHVHIVQQHGDTNANIYVNFPAVGDANVQYDIHVHEFGDMSTGCDSLGGHLMHGEEDIGDLGAVTSLDDGSISTWINSTQVSLTGPDSIVGRSIMIHEHDGTNMACCVIGWSAEMDSSSHHMTHEDHHADHAHHGHHKHSMSDHMTE